MNFEQPEPQGHDDVSQRSEEFLERIVARFLELVESDDGPSRMEIATMLRKMASKIEQQAAH